IDCHGVGYEVTIPVSTYEKLPLINNETLLFIHFYMNDEGIRLFGFHTTIERELFRLLLGVSRIGPKLAISILSGITKDSLISAIGMGKEDVLASVPGLGKKSAQRIIIELKDKIDKFEFGTDYQSSNFDSTLQTLEVENALSVLGYKIADIRKVLKPIMQEGSTLSTEEMIKKAIKELYRMKN
ncbi:MAG: Holliday junction branch migration protein RuvA, partial [Candidatus Cloacimonetes bacterium]|nr:Holliday junction branch migration protein RuvA [Candidatus Cloacimonadota bacterium]